MARLRLAAPLLVLLLGACGTGSTQADLVAQTPAPVIVTKADFGTTIEVGVGQIIEFDLPGWSILTRSAGLLHPISVDHPRQGIVRYQAADPGSERITAWMQPDYVCGVECNAPARQERQFVVVVAPRGQAFDLVLSELDSAKTYLVTPGMRVLVAVAATELPASNPAASIAGVDGVPSLSLVTVERPGLLTLSRVGQLHLDIVVRPTSSRYDIVVPQTDGGRTIHATVGQIIAFRLQTSSGFLPWKRGLSGLIGEVLDPAAEAPGTQTFVYVVEAPGTATIQFVDDPSCVQQDACGLLSRTIDFGLEISR